MNSRESDRPASFEIHRPTRSEIALVQELVAEIVDGANQHVDGGIREAVATFNVLGFQTAASCEGRNPSHPAMDFRAVKSHSPLPVEKYEFDGEYTAPTVHITADDDQQLGERLDAMKRLLAEFYRDRKSIEHQYRLQCEKPHRDSFCISNAYDYNTPMRVLPDSQAYAACKAEIDAFIQFLQRRYYPAPQKVAVTESASLASHIERLRDSIRENLE